MPAAQSGVTERGEIHWSSGEIWARGVADKYYDSREILGFPRGKAGRGSLKSRINPESG